MSGLFERAVSGLYERDASGRWRSRGARPTPSESNHPKKANHTMNSTPNTTTIRQAAKNLRLPLPQAARALGVERLEDPDAAIEPGMYMALAYRAVRAQGRPMRRTFGGIVNSRQRRILATIGAARRAQAQA